ncbi:MAG: hypothetical protein VX733_00680 [Candidatus Latescibacterota bacterium]|nr:hypothetical protein [Candidatus Latescibacterota bacterium]
MATDGADGLITDMHPLDIQRPRNRGVDTPCHLRTFASLDEWQAQASHLRERILACTGLLPLPERTPLRARVFGRIEIDGCSIEKVHFESLPGVLVCGNLYRPLGQTGKTPGILSPHGHWSDGRLEDSEAGSVPGRGVSLARLGCVTFNYDMAGYTDSRQIEHRRFGSELLDLWGVGVLGLQLWNSIRALDFVAGLPDVDATRIGCTGASGGGTQTFLLTAVDDRVSAAAPVNMISAHMQGGCNCENQAHLRVGTNNVEIASCMAPRPMLMVSATGDWTVHTPYHEFVAVRQVYNLYGAGDKLSYTQIDAVHNYNRSSREAVYGFFYRWLLGGNSDRPRREPPFAIDVEELRVFTDGSMPARALDASEVGAALADRALRRARQRPRSRRDLVERRRGLGAALRQCLVAKLPAAEQLRIADRGRQRVGDRLHERFLLATEGGDFVPVVICGPQHRRRAPIAMIVHGKGKDQLFDRQGRPRQLVGRCLDAGLRVAAVDCSLVGEAASVDGVDPMEMSNHYYTYNPSRTSQRVQDILTVIAYLTSRPDVGALRLLGVGEGAGLWTLFAAALAGRNVERAIVDITGFRCDRDEDWLQQCWVPGIRAAGDLITAASLIAPRELAISGAGSATPVASLRAVYRAAHVPSGRLRISPRRWNVTQQTRFLSA